MVARQLCREYASDDVAVLSDPTSELVKTRKIDLIINTPLGFGCSGGKDAITKYCGEWIGDHGSGAGGGAHGGAGCRRGRVAAVAAGRAGWGAERHDLGGGRGYPGGAPPPTRGGGGWVAIGFP